MPHTQDHYIPTGSWLYFSLFASVIFHAMFSQNSQSSVRAAVLHIPINPSLYSYTNSPFFAHASSKLLLYRCEYSTRKNFTDQLKNLFSDIYISSSHNGYCFIFHSNLPKSQDNKTQISSQLKITNQKSHPFFPVSATCSKFFFQCEDPGISSCFKCTEGKRFFQKIPRIWVI